MSVERVESRESPHPGVPIVRHATGHAGPLADYLADYLAAVGSGRSVLVRPRTPYAGFERVREHVARLSGVDVLVTDLAGHSELVPATGPRDATSDGPLLAFHTSGSTGSPKCVVYRLEVVHAHAEMVARSLRLEAGLRYLALTPAHFAYGLSIVHSHARARVPVAFAVDPSSTSALGAQLEQLRPQVVYALPQQVTHLLAAADRLTELRRLVFAGGRLSQAGAAALTARFGDLELVNMYGQAELGPRLATWHGRLSTFEEGCLGLPVEGVVLETAEPDPATGLGELLACTPYAMSHLLSAPYDEVHPGPAPGALVATGDAVRRGPQGFVHEGRLGRFANIAGTRIDLAEAERHIARALPATALSLSTRATQVSGDDVLVVQIVPAPGETYAAAAVRRTLHPVLGSLTALTDIRVVDHLTVGEAGK